MHVRAEYIKCGKKRCKCYDTTYRHGPYWYGYFRENGKLKKVYIGKTLPNEHQVEAERDPEPVDRWEIPRRWTVSTALRVLGVGRIEDARKAYRDLVKRFHPDVAKGRDADVALRAMQAINGAWQFLSRAS